MFKNTFIFFFFFFFLSVEAYSAPSVYKFVLEGEQTTFRVRRSIKETVSDRKGGVLQINFSTQVQRAKLPEEIARDILEDLLSRDLESTPGFLCQNMGQASYRGWSQQALPVPDFESNPYRFNLSEADISNSVLSAKEGLGGICFVVESILKFGDLSGEWTEGEDPLIFTSPFFFQSPEKEFFVEISPKTYLPLIGLPKIRITGMKGASGFIVGKYQPRTSAMDLFIHGARELQVTFRDIPL